MTSLQHQPNNTIADRHAAIQADALIQMIDLALHHPHSGIRLNAQRRLTAYAVSAHRAAEDVLKQREYEQNFERYAHALAFGSPIPELEPRRTYGQPGDWTGD